MRKVCAGMSKQRYILILVFLLLFYLMSAQTVFTLHDEMLFSDKGINKGFLQRQVIDVNADTGMNTKIEAGNDWVMRDAIRAGNIQGLYNRTRLRGFYNHKSFKLGMGTSATIYNASDSLNFYPQWTPLTVYSKRNRLSAFAKAGKQLSLFDIHGEVLYDKISMDASEFSWQEFALVPAGRKSMADYRAELSVTANLGKGLSVLMAADYKDTIDEETDLFRMNNLSLGLGYQHRLSQMVAVESKLNWQNRQSKAIDEQRRNRYETNLRMRLNLSPSLIGFIHYINLSCSDDELSELLLISNHVKTYMKYSFSYDESAASYFGIGGKYSPNNKASSVSAETDFRLTGPFYAGAKVGLRQRKQEEYALSFSYHFSGFNNLQLLYKYRKNPFDNWRYSYAGVGLSLYY